MATAADLKSVDFIVKVIEYVNNYVPVNLPADFKSKVQIFYMDKVRKGLDQAWKKYGNFPLEFHKANYIWTDELAEKYPACDEDTVDEAVRLITKDLIPPTAWNFDYVNGAGPDAQDGFWEMYQAYEQGQF